MDELIGKVVRALYVNGDDSILLFATVDGDVAYETWADCCSVTWFADIIGVPYLLGHKIVAVESVDLPAVEDGRTRQEEDSFYGAKLTTDAGYVDIVYRNSSNGYYGGYINPYTGGRPDDLRQITADWRA